MQTRNEPMTVTELVWVILYFGSIAGCCWFVLWLLGALT